jgi:hypothetical protein
VPWEAWGAWIVGCSEGFADRGDRGAIGTSARKRGGNGQSGRRLLNRTWPAWRSEPPLLIGVLEQSEPARHLQLLVDLVEVHFDGSFADGQFLAIP